MDGSPLLTERSGMIWEDDISGATSSCDSGFPRILLGFQAFLLLFKGSTSVVVPPDGFSVARQMLMVTNSAMRMYFIVYVWGGRK